MTGWSERDYTPFFLIDEPTHTIKEIRAEYTRQRDIVMKRANRLESAGLGAQANYLRGLLPSMKAIRAEQEEKFNKEVAALRKKGRATEAARMQSQAGSIIKGRVEGSITSRLAEGKVQSGKVEYSLKGLRQLQKYFEQQTGEEVPLGEVLNFNEYMKSWRESAFSSSYVVSGDAAAMWAGDYQDVGGTFSEFYSISYLYS